MGYCVQVYMVNISFKQKFCPSELFHYLSQSMRTCPLHETSPLQHPARCTNAQHFIRNNCLFWTISQPNNHTLAHSWKQKTKHQTSLMPTTGVRHGWINSVSHRCFMTHLSTIRVTAIFPNTSWSSQRPLSKMPNLSIASTLELPPSAHLTTLTKLHAPCEVRIHSSNKLSEAYNKFDLNAASANWH